MTTEECFDRIEHISAGLAEERRRDREEYKALWRDLASRTESIARNVDALAVETRLRFDQVADQIAETNSRVRELAQESRAANQRLEERIAALVSAISQHVREGHPGQ